MATIAAADVNDHLAEAAALSADELLDIGRRRSFRTLNND
jgi:hypothetical protein